jgi:hypothetical protein
MSEEDEKPELEPKHERQIKAAIKKLNDKYQSGIVTHNT